MAWGFVPLDFPTELDLDELAPLVRELVVWLDPEDCGLALAGLVRGAPAGLLDDAKAELTGRMVPVPWTLNTIVRHALVPLAELSLVNGQPVIPELGTALICVLADPRLGASQRREVELALLDSEEYDAELDAEARAVDDLAGTR